MALVNYLAEAREDLFKIWDYVAQQSHSMEIADRLIDSIDDSAATFATSPEIGIPRFELADRLRCFPVKNYVVFYLPIEDGIEIVQVIHGSRDIPTHFRRLP